MGPPVRGVLLVISFSQWQHAIVITHHLTLGSAMIATGRLRNARVDEG